MEVTPFEPRRRPDSGGMRITFVALFGTRSTFLTLVTIVQWKQTNQRHEKQSNFPTIPKYRQDIRR